MKNVTKSKRYIELINEFEKVLYENFDEEDLKFYNQNIKTVKIYKLNKVEEFLLKNDAIYNAKTNSIILGKDILNIFHELFHLASTYINGDEFRIGFVQNNIGVAITEGYTELLAKRFFNIKGNGYENHIKYASMLEDIIGKKCMSHLYLTANFDGLIEELGKYSSIDEARRFIIKLDNNVYNFSYKEEEALNKLIKYLFKCYLNSLNQKLENNIITIKDYEKLVLKFALKYNIRNLSSISKEINNSLVKKKVLN